MTHMGHKQRRGDREGNSWFQYRDLRCGREVKTLNPHFLKFHAPHSHFKCLSCHKAFPESSARGACSLVCTLSP